MSRTRTRILACVIGVSMLAACSGSVAAPRQIPPPPSMGPGAQSTQGYATPSVIGEADRAPKPTAEEQAGLILRSAAFADGGEVPAGYTCDGENASPALSWSGVPEESQALAVIVYDPDAGLDLGATTDLGFIHWLVYDLPVSATGLAAGATGDVRALLGGVEAPNDFIAAAGSVFPGGSAIRGTGYDGPCPPERHSYVFRLMALDQPLGLPADTPPRSVLQAMEGHALAVADWTGTYGAAR
jgi:Raf kinase inhibitor-like YbhB/YbcL family protein